MQLMLTLEAEKLSEEKMDTTGDKEVSEVDGGGGGVEQEETTKGNTNRYNYTHYMKVGVAFSLFVVLVLYSKEEEEPMETEGEDKPAEEKNSSPVDVISVGDKLCIDNFNASIICFFLCEHFFCPTVLLEGLHCTCSTSFAQMSEKKVYLTGLGLITIVIVIDM